MLACARRDEKKWLEKGFAAVETERPNVAVPTVDQVTAVDGDSPCVGQDYIVSVLCYFFTVNPCRIRATADALCFSLWRGQKRARKGLVQPQAWRAWQARPFSARC